MLQSIVFPNKIQKDFRSIYCVGLLSREILLWYVYAVLHSLNEVTIYTLQNLKCTTLVSVYSSHLSNKMQ